MISEGRAKIETDGVFYNPRMRFCRDLDVLIFSELKARSYLDALAASGVRGIRAMLEAGYTATFNDLSKKAVEVIKNNLSLNGLEADVFNKDASLLMREKRFEHVDVDPFGSPANFIDSACFSATKYLSVTATDTAALCGSATTSGLRKYSSFAIKTDMYPEIGLRMLIGKIAREATKYEKAVEVLISWIKEHYYRVHLRLKKSTSFSGKVYRKIGYLFYCQLCHAKRIAAMDGSCYERCGCGSRYTMIGPIWIGELKNRELLDEVLKTASDKLESFLQKIKGEADVAAAYNLHAIARRLRISSPKVENVVEALRSAGFMASKTHYSGLIIKTDAEMDEIEKTVLASNTKD
jgi:tRNA (guanine26-N2/guanine27-N2)-dimethyltransferase